MEAKISLAYTEERKARAISRAISPDNVVTPENLSVRTITKNGRVITIIIYEGENFSTLQSTIDDLLSCVSIAEKTISAIKS